MERKPSESTTDLTETVPSRLDPKRILDEINFKPSSNDPVILEQRQIEDIELQQSQQECCCDLCNCVECCLDCCDILGFLVRIVQRACCGKCCGKCCDSERDDDDCIGCTSEVDIIE